MRDFILDAFKSLDEIKEEEIKEKKKLNESTTSKPFTTFEDITASSYNHFAYDLGRDPVCLGDVVDDIIHNYEGYENEGNTPEDYKHFYDEVAISLNRQNLDWVEELDEDKKKKDKITYVGNPDAEVNFFNKAMGNVSSAPATADGGVGSISIAEGVEKEYYYNYDVLCDEYCNGGVIHRDEEAYAKSYEDLCKQVRDEWDYNYNLDEVEEYGPIEIKINYSDDPAFKSTNESLNESTNLYDAMMKELESVDESLNEDLPYDISQAYRKTLFKNINKSNEADTNFNINKRRGTTLDFKNTNYEKIDKEKALDIYKNQPDKLQDLIFIFKAKEPWSSNEKEKVVGVVKYNDKGVPIAGIDDYRFVYTDRNGNEKTKSRDWPVKAVIDLATDIYLSDESQHKIDTSTSSVNPDYDKEGNLKTYNNSWDDPYTDMLPYVDFEGNFKYQYSDPISQSRYENSITTSDTGKHYRERNGWTDSGQMLSQLKYLQDARKDYNRYKAALEKAKLENDSAEINRLQNRLNDVKQYMLGHETNYLKYKDIVYNKVTNYFSKFLSQKDLTKYKIFKSYLNSVKNKVNNIKTDTWINKYSRNMAKINSLEDEIKKYKQSILDLENQIMQIEADTTEEDKYEYELMVQEKLNKVAENYFHVKSKMDELLRKKKEEEGDNMKESLDTTNDNGYCYYKIYTQDIQNKEDILDSVYDTEEQYRDEIKSLIADDSKKYTRIALAKICIDDNGEITSKIVYDSNNDDTIKESLTEAKKLSDEKLKEFKEKLNRNPDIKQWALEHGENLDNPSLFLTMFLELEGDNRDDDKSNSNLSTNESLTESKKFNVKNDNDMLDALAYKSVDKDKKEDLIAIDPNIESKDQENRAAVGDALLECNHCYSIITMKVADLEKEEDSDVYNKDFACPHCGSKDGYNYIAQLASPEVADEEEDEEEKQEDTLDIDISQDNTNTEDNVEVKDNTQMDLDINEIQEESFNRLINNYTSKLYENIKSYKTTSVTECKDGLKITGILESFDGKMTSTNFIFQPKLINGKLILEGYNKALAQTNFKINCNVEGSKLICEDLHYSYPIKVANRKKLVEGNIK